jgi:thiamine kinase-like enzyme
MTFSLSALECVTPAAAGRTNVSYILNFKDAKCILRISKEKADVHVIDRKFEAEVLHEASKAKLTPPVIATGRNFILTEFYENQNSLDAMTSLQQIMPRLSEFHGLMQQQLGMPVFEDVLKARTKHVRENCSDVPNEFWALEGAVLRAVSSPEYQALPRVLCHLDLTPRNILFGAKGIKFIDFEMANWGPRLLDFASISVGYGLNDEQERKLVGDHYDSNPQTLDSFYKTKLCYHFRCATWLLTQREIEENNKWREPDLKDLELDIKKAFACIDKIDNPKRGTVNDKGILPSTRNCGP